MKTYSIFGTFLLVVNLGFVTFGQDSILTPEQRLEIGNRVFSDSQKAIYGKRDFTKMSGFELVMEGKTISNRVTKTSDTKSRNQVTENRTEEGITFLLPDNGSLISTLSQEKNGIPTTVVITQSFNGDSFSEATDMYRDGKRIDLASLAPMLPATVSSEVKGKLSTLQLKPSTAQVKERFWELIYPIILASPWSSDSKPKYIFLGKAKVGGTDCDLIELDRNTEKKIHLYFDQSTKLLVLMTIEKKTAEIESKESYYYSDFSLTDGMLIPKKIDFQSLRASQVSSDLANIVSQTTTIQGQQKVVKFELKSK